MRKPLIVFALLTLPLSACMQDPASRGITGAAAGALVADATGGKMLKGAAIGGLAGVASCSIPGTMGCSNGY